MGVGDNLAWANHPVRLLPNEAATAVNDRDLVTYARR